MLIVRAEVASDITRVPDTEPLPSQRNIGI
jgi:hypothetical protein